MPDSLQNNNNEEALRFQCCIFVNDSLQKFFVTCTNHPLMPRCPIQIQHGGQTYFLKRSLDTTNCGECHKEARETLEPLGYTEVE